MEVGNSSTKNSSINLSKDSFMSNQFDKEDVPTVKDNGADYSKGVFIPIWVLLILTGIVIEFMGRLIGLENSPLTYHPWAPLGTTALSGILVVVGYFIFNSAKERQSTLRRRNGLMLIITGFLMLAASMILKPVVDTIFG
jgi:hypothetical protein